MIEEGIRRVCFILPGLDTGGIEKYVYRFLIQQAKGGTYTIVIKSMLKGDLSKDFEALPVKIVYQRISYYNLYKWFKFYIFLKASGFDSVCDFSGNFAGIPLLLARLSGVRKRIAFYRRSSRAFKSTLLRNLYDSLVKALVLKCATRILSNSHYAFEYFFPDRSSSDLRFKVIPNGIDIDGFCSELNKVEARRILGIPLNCFVIGHVGRFNPAKNHEAIFHVAELLRKSYSNLCFVFCGRGTDSTEFRTQLENFCIDDITISLGLQLNVSNVLSAFDLFYFPSITEGQPNSLIESIICGLPIVASDIPSIREIIPVHMREKFLVGPEDIDGACQRIEKYILGEQMENDLRDEICRRFNAGTNFKMFLDEL